VGVALVCGAVAQGLEIPFDFQPSSMNQVEFSKLDDGSFQVRTLGNDPYLEFSLPNIDDPTAMPVLAFEYFCVEGVQGIEVRLRNVGPWNPPIDAGALGAAQGWVAGALPMTEAGNTFWDSGKAKRLRIDLGQQTGVTIRIRDARFRELTDEERREVDSAVELRAVKSASAEIVHLYLTNDDWEGVIESVNVDDSSIRIRGRFEDQTTDVYLSELQIHEVSAFPGARNVVHTFPGQRTDGVAESRVFDVRLPRLVEGRDRLTSRWQLVETSDLKSANAVRHFTPISHAKYATDLRSAASGLDLAAPESELRNAKGMGGVSPVFGLDELIELGVRHLTLNLVVTDLIQDTEMPGAESFEVSGRRWWIRPGRLAHADQVVKFATEHGIQVAAIILVPQKSKDILVHPESTSSGIYAMPNLSEAEAAFKYEAVMGMLTERYRGGKHGRVDHWIMHNEVDFGWIWTNMGEQPLALFMDHYIRSMRMVALLASRFNPDAKAFISLTHHWNVPEDLRWRTYSPRKQLDFLANATRAEGDFAWGVAYHPYPQDLFNPRTWDDRRVDETFDTPLITMKNLEVLKKYLLQDRFLDGQGGMRSVLLSEQGYHTAGYGKAAQELQAAALLYTWKRLRETDFVVAYDYHRWVDAAEEGGLLLGLRMVGSEGRPAGDKKLGWEVFRAIDTEEEAEWVRKFESVYSQ
jgi:hypothetical protein